MEFQHFSDTDVFEIVGETSKLNPQFFMKHLYKNFRKKMGKIIGTEKLKEMEKYILEKYYLHEGEHIFIECSGDIGQNKKMAQPLILNSVNIFITNDRIIAQGKLFKGNYSKYSSELAFYGYIFPIKRIFRLRRVRNNIRYRVILDNSSSEINLKISRRYSQEIVEELINKIFEVLNKEVVEESQI